MLLATNFRPSSVAATQLATQMANQFGAELHAVYVIGDYFEQISVMFPEGGMAALTRLRSYVEERMAHLSRGGGANAHRRRPAVPGDRQTRRHTPGGSDRDRNRGARIVIWKQPGVGIGD